MARYVDFLGKGVTYRQLFHWTQRGYLRASNAGCGSGHDLHWPDAELRVADTIYRLREAGLSLDAAHKVARGTTELAPGVTVLVDGQVAA